jgi:glycosyltransferase involved in cell wall biosynthesis
MSKKLKSIAIIGTNGIPARYGGFETLAEYLTKELGERYNFFVYCSSIYSKSERRSKFNNSRLFYIPLKANGLQSIFYDVVTTFHAWFKYDILLVLGPSAGFMLPLNRIFGKKLIVNCGGLDEWKREKFSLLQKAMVITNFKFATKSSSFNIADNEPLKKSLKKKFNVESEVISYGGDHIQISKITDALISKYSFLSGQYDLSISRAQEDNNLHLVLETYKSVKSRNLVLISNWGISEYGRNLKKEYNGKYSNIVLLDAVYDVNLLNVFRSNTSLYVHSHSRCGTAPSLVEAMNYNIPIISFDVETNRLTTKNKTLYFSSISDLKSVLNSLSVNELSRIKTEMFKIAKQEYTWQIVANNYANLFDN